MSMFRDLLTDMLVETGKEHTMLDPTYELKNGFEYLHKGYCNMSNEQRTMFDAEFGSGVREALIHFARHEPAANADIAGHVVEDVPAINPQPTSLIQEA